MKLIKILNEDIENVFDPKLIKLAKRSINFSDFVTKVLIGKEIQGKDIYKLRNDKQYLKSLAGVWLNKNK